MPLIELKTNLKSLKFGIGTASDRPGGGYSNQPYIIKDIPSNESDPSNVFNTGGPDSLLRGGLMAPIKAIDDVSRLTQMFFDLKSPNGLLFTAKQNVLSRTSVKTESSLGGGTGGGNVNQGIYLPTSTIAQSGVGFLGIHGNLLGINPTSPGPHNDSLQSQKANFGLVKYEQASLFNNEVDNNTYNTSTKTTFSSINPSYNTGVTSKTGTSQPISNTKVLTFEDDGNFSNRLLDIWYNKQRKENDNPNIITYSGGPGSILGVGKTNIKFQGQTSRDRTGLNNPLSKTNKNFFYNKINDSGSGRKEDISRVLDGKLNGVSQVSQIVPDFNPHISSSEVTPLMLGDGIDESRISSNSTISGRNVDEIKNTTNGRNPNTNREISSKLLGVSTISENSKLGGINNNTYPTLSTTTNPDRVSIPTSTEGRSDKDYIERSALWLTLKPKTQYASLVKESGASFLWDVGSVNIGSQPINNDFSSGGGFSVYEIGAWPTINPTLQGANNSHTWTQSKIIEEPSNPGIKTGNPVLQNFREKTTLSTLNPSYDPKNRKTLVNRVNLGDPGKQNISNSYTVGNGILDKITASNIYPKSHPDHGPDFNDLVKLSIGILRNDGTGTSDYFNFRSYIDSFSDAYTADWGTTQYVGRGDKFYNYKGFDRSINLSWTVYAASKPEIIPMYRKLNYLASSLSPDYSSGGFMQGNLARLTVGGYLYNQLGIIRSITYDVPSESTWEIGINTSGDFDDSVEELPHMIKVTGFTFTPIEHSIPKKGHHFIHLAHGGKSDHYGEGYPTPNIAKSPTTTTTTNTVPKREVTPENIGLKKSKPNIGSSANASPINAKSLGFSETTTPPPLTFKK